MIAAQNTTETNYLSEVEATFNSARGAHKILSGVDSHLMIEWNERSIPLHIVCGAIKSAFSGKSPNERAAVNSLAFVKSAVESAFKMWQTAQIGSHAELPKADVIEFPELTDENEQVRQILAKLLDETTELGRRLKADELLARPQLIETVTNIFIKLRDLKKNRAQHRNCELIENSLAELRAELDNSLKANLTAAEQRELSEPIKQFLEKYRRRWNQPLYDQTFDAIFAKAARAHFAAPHLTLFQ